MTGIEYVGDVTFKPMKNVDPNYRGTVEEWLSGARNDFVTMGFALCIIAKSDEEVETAMWQMSETEEECTDGAIQLLEAFIRYSERLKTDVKILEFAGHRMQVVCERMQGQETMEAVYRQ